jgi:hypothetical protein
MDQAFEAFAGYCVLSSFYESDFSPDVFRMGGGNDLSIDVFGMLINGELLHDEADVRACVEQHNQLHDVRIIVVQAKTSPGFDTKVVSDLADNLRHIIDSDPLPYPASSDVDNMRGCLKVIASNIAKLSGGLPRLHVRYVTTGAKVADMLRSKAKSAERSLSKLRRFEEVDVQCLTRDDLRGLYQRATQAIPAEFDVIRKLSPPEMPGIVQSMFALLPARELVERVLTDPAGNIRKVLFHENVRDFQGYNAVNCEIRDTLQDPLRRKRFAVLNNGITIVTRKLTVHGDRVHIRDFQIVNGCQTCHVLFHERAELTDEVQVSVRIVHSGDEEVIGGIIAATNRQTAVSEEELTAREDFHKHLEDFFAAQHETRRLYYERRSKQYSERIDVEKTRVINRPQLTRAFAAMWLDAPSEVGHYRTLCDDHRDELFKPDHHREAYLAAAATHYRIDWLLRTHRVQAELRPVRYHLIAAIKLRLFGERRLPSAPKEAAKACQRVLDVMWDAGASERLIAELLPAITKAIDVEKAAGVPLGEMVRLKRFADLIRVYLAGGRAG